MRWQGLFDDLEGQWAAEERLERDAEVADRIRAERARVELVERYAASRGARVSLRLSTGTACEGVITDVGADWLLLRDDAGRALLVSACAIVAAVGVSRRGEPAMTARRFRLGYALRALSRDRAAVVVSDTGGGRVTGTIDAVGADWCEVAEHPVDEPRRPATLRGVRTVPLGAIVSVLAAAPTDDARG